MAGTAERQSSGNRSAGRHRRRSPSPRNARVHTITVKVETPQKKLELSLGKPLKEAAMRVCKSFVRALVFAAIALGTFAGAAHAQVTVTVSPTDLSFGVPTG